MCRVFGILNMLVVGERRQRIQAPEIQEFFELLQALNIQTDRHLPIIENDELLSLARTHQLSI